MTLSEVLSVLAESPKYVADKIEKGVENARERKERRQAREENEDFPIPHYHGGKR